ncbi:MAG: ATP-binding protein [Lachnospira sp.]
MYITYIYIENFGVLSDYRYSPKPGLNEIYAENGAGKTTLSEFIRAMFFGMPGTRTRKQLNDALRKKYKPWQQGIFGGYVEFIAASKEYRLTRTFGDKESDDTFLLIDKATGLVSNDYTVNIGKELFGTDRDTFANTAWISGKDTRFAAGSGLYESLGEGTDISTGANSFEHAKKSIDDAIRYYKSTAGKGVINELEYKINNINDELVRLKNDYDDLNKERSALKFTDEEFKEENYHWKHRLEWLDDYFSGGVIESDELDRLLKENDDEMQYNRKRAESSKKRIVSGIVIIIIFAALLIISAAEGFFIAALLCLMMSIIFGYFSIKNVKRCRQFADNIKLCEINENKYKQIALYKDEYDTLSDIEREHEVIRKNVGAKLKNLKESAINEKADEILKKTADLKREKMTLSEQLKQASQRAELLTKTRRFMIMAKESYTVGYMDSVISKMRQYIRYFDEDLSSRTEIDVKFDVNILSGSTPRQIDYYSTGIKDIIWLCERFAVIDVLYKKEQPVMLLDDIFVNLDDKMFERGRKIAADMAQKRQIIYFTCRKNNSICR